MRLRIEIDMANAAFEEDTEYELQHILDGVPARVVRQIILQQRGLPPADDLLKDINGNTVGRVEIRAHFK